ncbi:MAG: glycosyltransferase family 39 protein [Anaerolineae bacterium]|nr:glycosyltransferase family 39 protein [Anaerolineae bacterium]
MTNTQNSRCNFPYGPILIVSLLVLLALALRVYQLDSHSLWYDELLELDIAQGPFLAIGPQLPRHAAMPLDYYLMHAWIKLGRQDFWVRLPALFFGVLAIPLTYALARRMINRRVGYLAAALMTTAFFAVRYSRETRPYAMLLVFTLLAFLGLWQVYRTHKMRYWAVAIAGLGGAALSHYFSLFLLLPMGLFVAGHQLYHLRQFIFWRHTACFAVAVLVLAILFALNGRILVLYSVSYRFSNVVNQPETLALPAEEKPNHGSGPPLDPGFFVTDVLSPLSTTAPLTLLWYSAFFLIAVLALVRPGSAPTKAILLLLGWFILPILLVYTFLLHRGTFYATRYILYVLPAYLILVAYGIDRLAAFIVPPTMTRLPYRRGLLAGVLTLLLAPALSAQYDDLHSYYSADAREDWRAVGQLLYNHAAPDDVVIAVKAEPTINWYYPPAAAPFETYGRSDPINAALRQHKRRWFVLSSYSYRRDENLRNWLAPRAVKLVIDRRVVVYLQEDGKTTADLLAEVKQFTLPPNAITYAYLAEQFKQYGDVESSRAFYQQAIALASSSGLKAQYEARLAALPHVSDTLLE